MLGNHAFTIEVHLFGVKICLKSQHGGVTVVHILENKKFVISIEMMTGPPYLECELHLYHWHCNIQAEEKKGRRLLTYQGYTEPGN
jgi:hypothetical protein